MYVAEMVDVKWWADVEVRYPFMLGWFSLELAFLTFVVSVVLSQYFYAGNAVNVGFKLRFV